MDSDYIITDIQLAALKAEKKHEYNMAELELRKRYAAVDERRVAVEEKRLALEIAIAKRDGVILD
jgi:hypothetical protein